MSEVDEKTLIAAAREAMDRAWAPYSQFPVGAAVATRDGRIFQGCNVENPSYSLCICAERSALFAAVAAGCRPGDFMQLAVIADTVDPVSPCGACRQVMIELGGKALVVIQANLGHHPRHTTAGALLPGMFTLPTG